jgi:hypothetical protein
MADEGLPKISHIVLPSFKDCHGGCKKNLPWLILDNTDWDQW